LPPWARYSLGVASLYLVVVAFVGFVTVDEEAFRPAGDYHAVVYDTQYGNVRDVFAYDANGQLLRDVRLFDQDGNPVILGFQDCEPHLEPSNVYPRCPDRAPFTVPGTSPTPAPTASPTPTPTPTPTPPPTPTPSPVR
jgi:hypothetical protein